MGCGGSKPNIATVSKEPPPPAKSDVIDSKLNPISSSTAEATTKSQAVQNSTDKSKEAVNINTKSDTEVLSNTKSKLIPTKNPNKDTSKLVEQQSKEAVEIVGINTKLNAENPSKAKSKSNPTNSVIKETAKHIEVHSKNVVVNVTAEVCPKVSSIPPKFSGFMSRQGSVFRKWQQRYFVLEKGELSYYEGEDCLRMVGRPLNLSGYMVTEMDGDELLISIPGRKSSISDHLQLSTLDDGDSEEETVRQLHVKIGSKEERAKWEKSLQEHIDYMNR